MIRLSVRFPSGRYHATPWDHHVNEGVVEWPPSPWRILRALTSALHTRAHRVDKAVAQRALAKLDRPPSFTLPRATVGHTRHYLSQNALDARDTSMVFDTFVVIDRGAEVIVHWPCDLAPDERAALAALAAEVSYLGRAEAWADLRVLDAAEVVEASNCEPSSGVATPGTTTVRALCPAEGFAVADLERTTSALQREGWSDPPGTRYVFYRRDSGAFASPHTYTSPRPARVRPTVAEFALECGPGAVLPLLVDAVRVGEQFRRAVMSYYRGREVRPAPVFSGRDGEGDTPRHDQHAHAHYLPDAREHRARGQRERHRVTHVVVWAPEGFDEEAQSALRHVRYLSLPWRRDRAEERAGGKRDGDLDVVLTGFGDERDLARESELFGEGARWRSRTPFVLPRHPKAHRDAPEDQLRRELAQRGVTTPVKLARADHALLGGGERPLRWMDFRRWREGDQVTTGFTGFELTFEEPVSGPLLLGYGSHYGLGQFEVAP